MLQAAQPKHARPLDGAAGNDQLVGSPNDDSLAGGTLGDALFGLFGADTLRGVPFGDTYYLLGREFVYATAELQFPIFEFLSFPLIDLEGVLGFDMGGTSTDVHISDGAPRETLEATVDGLPVRVPMLEIHTVGAGGGYTTPEQAAQLAEARDEAADSVRLKGRGDARITIGARAASKLLVTTP